MSFTTWNYKLELTNSPSSEKEPKTINNSYEPRFMIIIIKVWG